MAVKMQHIAKKYGNFQWQIDELEIHEGERFALLGPSGSGKSSTLRIIAGFDQPDQGNLFLFGESAMDLPAHQRGVGIVFQDYTLFPHLNVAKNIRFGMDLQKLQASLKKQRVRDLLEMVSLPDHENRLVDNLSGGEMQRVALARSLAVNPKILLLDEPFSALDNLLRADLRKQLLAIQKQQNLTMIFVTHQFEEALAFADRIALMHQGRILQVGSPEEIYHFPQSLFAARFLGETNIFTVKELNKNFPEKRVGVSQKYAMLRCHWLQIAKTQSENTPYPATLIETEYHGFFRKIRLQFQEVELIAYSDEAVSLNQKLFFGFAPKNLHFFNDD